MKFILSWWLGKKTSMIVEFKNNTFKYGDDIYQISNIVRVTKFKKPDKFSDLFILLLIASIAITLLGYYIQKDPLLVIIGVIMLFVFTCLYVFYLVNKITYYIEIKLNNSDSFKILTKSKYISDKIHDILLANMNYINEVNGPNSIGNKIDNQFIIESFKLKKVKTADKLVLLIVPKD